MKITFITSLYRSTDWLRQYRSRLLKTLPALVAAGYVVEVLLIANDADDPEDEERNLIHAITTSFASQPDIAIHEHYVERESLYASWNRGLRLMTGDVFGFWNVDDERDTDAVIAACKLLEQGYSLVDAPMRVAQPRYLAGNFKGYKTHVTPVLYDAQIFTRKRTYGPFALHRRELYEQVGAFDEHFRIAGDIEWGGRARKFAHFHPLAMPGGTFFLHGNNLSSNSDVRQQIEENIVFLRAGLWDEVRPTPDPVQMRKLWDDWGNPDGRDVPAALAGRLWGDDALDIWRAWDKERRRTQRAYALRRLPRTLIDSLGWRPALARIGLVKNSDPAE